jgi:hypothetical protein
MGLADRAPQSDRMQGSAGGDRLRVDGSEVIGLALLGRRKRSAELPDGNNRSRSAACGLYR